MVYGFLEREEFELSWSNEAFDLRAKETQYYDCCPTGVTMESIDMFEEVHS